MSSSHREGVNPLRPYYIPPTIGERAEPTSTTAGPGPVGGNATGARYASKARDALTDLDYKNYLGDEAPGVVQNVKNLLDELLWKYTSVLMAQPFEVAKVILQVRDQDENAVAVAAGEPEMLKKRTSSYGSSIYDFQESDSDGDEPAYFTSNAPDTSTPSHRSRNSRYVDSPIQSPKIAKKPSVPEHFLSIRRSDSVTTVISALWNKEGAWGVWKGSNATFLYTVLQSLLENWSRSFLSAIFNVPDLGVKDDIDRLVDIASPYPWASLFVAASAAVATGVLLAPLDMVRTRLILTPSSRRKRTTLATLRSLPSYVCSSAIFFPTVLHSLLHPIFTLSTPLVLRTRFMIDSQISPMTFSIAKFCASSVAVFVKLPLETVLRRGHMAVMAGKDYVRALSGKEQSTDTIVPVGQYKGVWGTMFHIAGEEGQREVISKPGQTKKGKGRAKASAPVYKKGQGVEGLWRGWKVSWWGLAGLWMASILQNGGEGEF